MKWINIKDKKPPRKGIIVAIMNGRFEQGGDPVQWVDIVMVRCDNGQFFSMDCTKYYYLPDKEKHHSFYYETINYWMPYEEFNFPAPLLLPKES